MKIQFCRLICATVILTYSAIPVWAQGTPDFFGAFESIIKLSQQQQQQKRQKVIAVKRVQRALARLSFYRGKIDGDLGSGTEEAISSYYISISRNIPQELSIDDIEFLETQARLVNSPSGETVSKGIAEYNPVSQSGKIRQLEAVHTEAELNLKHVGEGVWVVAASGDELENALAVAQSFARDFWSTIVVRSGNGRYAILLGWMPKQEATEFKNSLQSESIIPSDAFLSIGEKFGLPIWSVDAQQIRTRADLFRYSLLRPSPTVLSVLAKQTKVAKNLSKYVAQVHGLLSPANDYLSLKHDPSTDGAEVRKLPEGTPLQIIDTRRDWFQVNLLNGVSGWVSAKYVREKPSNIPANDSHVVKNDDKSAISTSPSQKQPIVIAENKNMPLVNSKFASMLKDAVASFERDDYATALKIWKPLAEQGDTDAQNYLGYIYSQNGGGVSRDYEESLKWYQKSAKQGDRWAQVILSLMYANGIGVLLDETAASQVYEHSITKNITIDWERNDPEKLRQRLAESSADPEQQLSIVLSQNKEKPVVYGDVPRDCDPYLLDPVTQILISEHFDQWWESKKHLNEDPRSIKHKDISDFFASLVPPPILLRPDSTIQDLAMTIMSFSPPEYGEFKSCVPPFSDLITRYEKDLLARQAQIDEIAHKKEQEQFEADLIKKEEETAQAAGFNSVAEYKADQEKRAVNLKAEQDKQATELKAEQQRQEADRQKQVLVEKQRIQAEELKIIVDSGDKYAALAESEWESSSQVDPMTDKPNVTVRSIQKNENGAIAQIDGKCLDNNVIQFTSLFLDADAKPTVTIVGFYSDEYSKIYQGELRLNSEQSDKINFRMGRFRNEIIILNLDNLPIGATRESLFENRSTNSTWRVLAKLETSSGEFLIKIPIFDPAIQQLVSSCVG